MVRSYDWLFVDSVYKLCIKITLAKLEKSYQNISTLRIFQKCPVNYLQIMIFSYLHIKSLLYYARLLNCFQIVHVWTHNLLFKTRLENGNSAMERRFLFPTLFIVIIICLCVLDVKNRLVRFFFFLHIIQSPSNTALCTGVRTAAREIQLFIRAAYVFGVSIQHRRENYIISFRKYVKIVSDTWSSKQWARTAARLLQHFKTQKKIGREEGVSKKKKTSTWRRPHCSWFFLFFFFLFLVAVRRGLRVTRACVLMLSLFSFFSRTTARNQRFSSTYLRVIRTSRSREKKIKNSRNKKCFYIIFKHKQCERRVCSRAYTVKWIKIITIKCHDIPSTEINCHALCQPAAPSLWLRVGSVVTVSHARSWHPSPSPRTPRPNRFE